MPVPADGPGFLLAGLLFIVAGFLIGAYGTIIGAGGGFLVVPLLFFLYPEEAPVVVTSTSLAVVLLNATSGSVAYGRQGRIDYRAGLLFGLAAMPAALIGASITDLVPRQVFGPLFGILLLIVAVYLFFAPRPGASPGAAGASAGYTSRLIRDARGNEYRYAFNNRAGMALTALAALVASFFGIGGGLLEVPLMIRVLHFPAAIATATSQLIILMVSTTATVRHLAVGAFTGGYWRALFLGVGVVFGAQVGAALSRRLGGTTVVRMLSLAQLLVAVRLLAVWFGG